MNTPVRLLLPLLAASALACSSEAGSAPPASNTSAALDCAWVAGDNCWKQALAEVAACVPQPDEHGSVTSGTLDAERRTCVYDDNGPTVRFDEPVVPFDSTSIGLSVEQGGEQCLRLDRGNGTVTLQVPSGTVTVEAVAGAPPSYTIEIQCTDGSSYRADDYLSTVQACDSDPSNWPGTVVEQSGPGSVGLDLGGGYPGQVTVFSCDY